MVSRDPAQAAAAVFEAVAADSPEALSAVSQYFAELDARFDGGFDAEGEAEKDVGLYEPPNGGFVLVRADGTTLACGCFQTIEPGIGEIKRMWVDPSWRGLGLAGRLLADLERRCRFAGHHTVRLDTNAVLVEAIAMYERFGYRSIARYNGNPYAQRWFEKLLE